MDQQIINWLLAGFGATIGFFVNAMWQALKDLQSAEKKLTEKLNQVEVLVAGAYVTRATFEQSMNRVFEKLDAIDAKIDKKADKK